MDHIIKESPLIELYRHCHMTVENGFHLSHRTIRHAPPDMTVTLRQLRVEIEKSSPHKFTPSRAAYHSTPDQIANAMHLYMTNKFAPDVEDEEGASIEGDDLAAG